jgi:hypothetical protein
MLAPLLSVFLPGHLDNDTDAFFTSRPREVAFGDWHCRAHRV